jgi:hypothetical protein
MSGYSGTVNARSKGASNDEGNTASFIETIAELIQINDGTRSFEILTEDCHDNPAPFNVNQETMVKITHPTYDVTQLEDGFLTFNVEVVLQATGLVKPDGTTIYTNDHSILFVGFKNSAEILQQLQITCRGKSVGLQDNECLREGFAYNTLRTKTDKVQKKGVHSLWEDVCKGSYNVCGTYVKASLLADGLQHPVIFQVVLPITDILSLQAFSLYPNFCLGDLELKFYIKPDALVVAQIPAKESLKISMQHTWWGDSDIKTGLAGSTSSINQKILQHSFCQMGTEFIGITAFDSLVITDNMNVIKTASPLGTATKESIVLATGLFTTEAKTALEAGATVYYSYKTGLVRINCNSMRVMQLKSSMFGFGIVNSSKNRIREFFSVPRYMPSQQLDYYSFPHHPTPNGIQTSLNAPLFNATMISFMFPKRTQDRTCFDNPQYLIQATVNGKNYPDESVSTVGARFFQQQLVASDLDGPIEATPEYVSSLSEIRNERVFDEMEMEGGGARIPTFPGDTSSFMFNVQLERSNAGYCFDGIDSNGQNISIQLKGNPISKGDDDTTGWNKDTYWSYEPWLDDAQGRPQNPEAWICRETYFRLSEREGLVYMSSGVPPQTQLIE